MNNLQEYLNRVLNIDSNTSATIIITVLIFITGIIATELVKFLSRYRERRVLRLILNSSILNIISQARRQVKAYEKTSEEFTWKGNRHFLISRAVLSRIESDYKMSFNAYFTGIENTSFNKKKKSKALNKLWESVQSLDYWHEKSFQDIELFLAKYSEFNNNRNEALDQHRKMIESILISVDGTSLPVHLGQYVQQVDDIHVTWQSAENRTRPDIVHSLLVNPLLELNRSLPRLQAARRSSDLLLTASLEYDNMDSLLSSYHAQFLNYARLFRYNYRSLSVALRLLEKCG